MKTHEIREMSAEDLLDELDDLEKELIKEKAIASSGSPENPGRIREIRRTIARIKTIMKEINKK